MDSGEENHEKKSKPEEPVWMTFEEYLDELQDEINRKDNEDFSEYAMELAYNPYKYGRFPDEDHVFSTGWRGPCGDQITYYLKIKDEIVIDGRFEVDGCTTTLMAGSQGLKLVENKTVEDAEKITEMDILNALGRFPKESEHCTILAANTLKKTLEKYKEQQK